MTTQPAFAEHQLLALRDHLATARRDEMTSTTRLIARIARDATPEEFVRFVNARELPAMVRLSPTQLEQLRGGWIVEAIVDAVVDALKKLAGPNA